MPIDARTSGGVYKVVSKILTADGSEIGKVMDSTGRIIYEASRLITVTGVPPISFTKSIGKPLVSWDLLGNAQQTGTPSPDNIIMPDLVGVRTGNLAQSVEQGGITNIGEKTTTSIRIRVKADVFPNTTYTFASNKPIIVISGFTGETYAHTIISPAGFPTQCTFTTGEDDTVVYMSLRNEDNTTIRPADLSGAMLNLGSTALPYEPYGYKIPFNNHGDNLAPPINEWVDGYVNGSTGLINTPSSEMREKTSGFLEIPDNATNVSFSGEDGKFVEDTSLGWRAIGFYDSDMQFISRPEGTGVGYMSVNVPENARFMRVTCRTYGSDKEYMLNTGTTALPYSPYFSETVPVYLGQVNTVRRIKKMVLTGEEDWHITSGIFYLDSVNPDYMRAAGEVTYMCSHFPASKQVSSAAYVETNTFAFGSSIYSQRVYYTYTGATTVADFKSYLAAQYAAGTPVTIWYILAEPETAIVNEPLAKIGDYADELHSTDAAVTIPTARGNNTLTVDTDLPPSSMTIVYKGR